MKQYQRKVDAKAISLDHIDTTAAWRSECQEPAMEVAPDWLADDHDHDDDTEAPYEGDPVPEEFHTESGSVPQLDPEPQAGLEGDRPDSSTATSGGVVVGLPPRAPSSSSGHQFQPPSGSRGHHDPFAGSSSSSRGRQIPVRGRQASRAPSPRGRARAVSTAITFSRKRGRGNP